MFQLNSNSSLVDFITLDTKATKQRSVYLVDSGAHVSLIRESALKPDFKIDKNDIIFMKGITNDRQKSLGSVVDYIQFKKITIEHKFYVVNNDFPMPSHGIVGKDFLKGHGCVLQNRLRPNEINNSVG